MSLPVSRHPVAVALTGLFLAAALAAAAPAHARTASPRPPSLAAPAYVLTTVALLNVRAAPRLAAPVLRRVPLGTLLRVRAVQGLWLAVATLDGLDGYIAARYARPARAPLVSPRAFHPPYLRVAVAVARLRAAPDPQAPVLRDLPRRTLLAVLGMRGTWMQVATRDGQVGWIARFLTRPA